MCSSFPDPAARGHLLERLAGRRPARRMVRGEALRELLRRLGDPQRAVTAVQIAGSKGKGSTALFLEAALEAGGLATGTFTSPHLERWTERFRLRGRELSPSRLRALLEHVEAWCPGLEEELSFFDAATAAALLLYRDTGVDCAIFEAGLGGGRDATSLVRPAVTCLTGVELEHTAILGDTVEAIAREKAGIARPGVPLVLGRLPAAARAEVHCRARAVGAPVLEEGRDFRIAAEAGDEGAWRLRFRGAALRLDVRLGVLGEHLSHCAGLAAACAEALPGARGCDAGAVAAGLTAARLPGRTEVLSTDPWIVVDAAHTAVSAAALAGALARLGSDVDLVLGVGRDKDIAALCRPLLPLLRSVVVTAPDRERSMEPERLLERLRGLAPHLPVRLEGDPERALLTARAGLGAGRILCVAGSVYLAGRARAVLGVRNGAAGAGNVSCSTSSEAHSAKTPGGIARIMAPDGSSPDDGP